MLISANPGIESEEQRTMRRESDLRLAEELTAGGLNAFVDTWYRQPLFESLHRHSAFEVMKSRRAVGSVEGLASALRGFSVGLQPPQWDRLAQLTIPLLAVAGEIDKKYVELAKRTADLCPQGKLCIISDAGHAVHLEAPKQLARAVRPLLTSAV